MFISKSKGSRNNKYHSSIVDGLGLEAQVVYRSWSVATMVYHFEIL